MSDSEKKAMGRRGFLKTAAATAGLAAAEAASASAAAPTIREPAAEAAGNSPLSKATTMPTMPTKLHQADVCVVGGGMAGLVAAVAAARHGAKVVLMQERPVLGGNSSSETRVHVCGADRHNGIKNMRETGILEECRLDNMARNRNKIFSIWDTILYEKAALQPGLTTLLNCTCQSARMEGPRIAAVTGWQLTTQTQHTVEASIFIDCSGDAILAPLTGAQYRVGREGRAEFNESLAPEAADARTMGMTCLFQAREHPGPQAFEPLPWAYRFDRCEDLPYGRGRHSHIEMGYWWVELGGEQDSIHDSEAIKHELLRITYGVWDHIKNRCPDKARAANWALEWVQFLPGKRESRRYIGDHVISQNDVEAEGRFPDLVAYGGWTMDDHHPAGFWAVKQAKPATMFHKSPSPYGIPYRSLYSRNVANLMFAGRCASATHMAMSSMRVMGTGSSMGQAAGTAAAIAAARKITPREVGGCMKELQQALITDDAYLPWVKQEFGPLTTGAKLTASRGDPAPVRDGINRPVGQDAHAWPCRVGDTLTYEFAKPARVEAVSLILDSALHKNIQMSYHQKDDQLSAPPPELQKAFHVDVLSGGRWETLARVEDNHQRLVRIPVGREAGGVRFVLDGTWGAEESRVFAFYVD